MLAVGRSFVSGRRMMLLDETSMGLATILMLSMFEAFKRINRDGTTILLVEQTAKLALNFVGRGYAVETGRIVIEGNSKDLQKNDKVKKAYLGG